jgi:hypothetical protein
MIEIILLFQKFGYIINKKISRALLSSSIGSGGGEGASFAGIRQMSRG